MPFILILILLSVSEIIFSVFWVYPRYDRFIAKYGNDPLFSPILWLCFGAWYHLALSSRRAWRNVIIMQSSAATFFVVILSLILVWTGFTLHMRDTSTVAKALVGHWRSNGNMYDLFFKGSVVDILDKDGNRTLLATYQIRVTESTYGVPGETITLSVSDSKKEVEIDFSGDYTVANVSGFEQFNLEIEVLVYIDSENGP